MLLRVCVGVLGEDKAGSVSIRAALTSRRECMVMMDGSGGGGE